MAAQCDTSSRQPRLIQNRLVQIKFKVTSQIRSHYFSTACVYKNTHCLTVWQKCSLLLLMHSSPHAVSCHRELWLYGYKIPNKKFRKCQCETHHTKSILCQILNKEHGSETKWHQQHHSPHCSTGIKDCSCLDRRRVVLKTPEAMCRRAFGVLLKTSIFIRNLPSFYHMPLDDQLVLIQQNWAPLFVLGMAQEGVDFDLRETSVPSLLKKILLNQSLTANNDLGSSSPGASLTKVQKMKNLLWKCWDLDISAKEYAYLKGIILFNSGPPKLIEAMGKGQVQSSSELGYELEFNRASRHAAVAAITWIRSMTGCCVLKCLPHVQTLQQEAQQALMEFVSTMFHGNLGRFASILQLIASLRDADADAIEELFFRPILGEAILNVLLLETLHIKPDCL